MTPSSSRCMLQDPVHRLLVLGVAGEGAHAGRGAGRRGVGLTRHEGGDGAGPRPPGVGVVGHAEGHEQGAQVGVAEAQLAEAAGRVGDALGGVVGVAHEDLLGGEHDPDGGPEALDVEAAVVVQEPEQVEAGQVARRVVEVHVLGVVDHDSVVGVVGIGGDAEVVGAVDLQVVDGDRRVEDHGVDRGDGVVDEGAQGVDTPEALTGGQRLSLDVAVGVGEEPVLGGATKHEPGGGADLDQPIGVACDPGPADGTELALTSRLVE